MMTSTILVMTWTCTYYLHQQCLRYTGSVYISSKCLHQHISSSSVISTTSVDLVYWLESVLITLAIISCTGWHLRWGLPGAISSPAPYAICTIQHFSITICMQKIVQIPVPPCFERAIDINTHHSARGA